MESPIMILGAMEDVELNILKEKINLSNVYKEKNYTFYEGKICGKDVVLGAINIGLINATVATLIGIKKYNPTKIILQGIAGAHGCDVHVNDIVVASKIININTLETTSCVKGEGSDSLKWTLNNFPGDATDISVETDKEIFELAQAIKYNKGNVLFGAVGSGDVWNKDVDRILMFNEKYQTLCEEMEGYAVAKVAQLYDVPMINVRVISNNEILKEKYQREVGKYSQEFILEILKSM